MHCVKGGRINGFTDINPMWRIKKLTELFGPCGIGWWFSIEDKRIVDDETTHQKAVFVDIMLYYRKDGETSQGIPGTGGASFVAQERSGPYMSDECFKMALTDALGVACKSLGIGADIYWAADRSKYTNPEPPTPKCDLCGNPLEGYGAGGQFVTIPMLEAFTLKKYGKRLCRGCYQAMADRDAKREAAEVHPA